MSNPEIGIRYGFIAQQEIEAFKESDHKDITIRVFEPSEDGQWQTGLLMATAKKLNKTLKARPEKETQKLAEELKLARKEGKVPFRVCGPKQELPAFLEETGLIKLKLLP